MPTKKKTPAQLQREIDEALAKKAALPPNAVVDIYDPVKLVRRAKKPPRQEWITDVIDAARPVLRQDRDLAIVTWPTGKRPALYGEYKLRPSATLRPYFATLAKVTEDKINGYVVVRYGDKIIVYTSPDTILARDEVG